MALKLPLLFSTLALCQGLAFAQESIYLGTYTKAGSHGIYFSRLNIKSGRLDPPQLAVESASPSFLVMHPRLAVLYAVNEDSNQVSAFRIEGNGEKLTPINREDTGGGGPCHLAVDASGRMLIVANYGGGSLATFPLASDGRIGSRKQLIQFTGSGPNRQRQNEPHAHSANLFDHDRQLFVNDLGTDRTMLYRVDAANAELRANDPPFVGAEPGSGPRHLVIDAKERFAYVIDELTSSIAQFALDAKSGKVKPVNTVSALAPDFHGSNTSAELALSSSGHTLYASNRGSDSISVFDVDPANGELKWTQSVPSGGKTPRHFALDPSGQWLVAANQGTGDVAVFQVDSKTGKLTATGNTIKVASAVCVLFAPK